MIADPDLGPRLRPAERQQLAVRFDELDWDLDVMVESVAMLHRAGVAILVGSDAPDSGTTYGASLRRELEYLIEAGMSPIEALASATSVPADIFGLDDRGRIAVDLIADLVLVEGDPTTDILATRAIAAVWKNGIPIAIR